jgi:hypothetical protein
MRPHLLFPDRDLVLSEDEPSALMADMITDLELPTIFRVMADKDPLIYTVCAQVLIAADTTPQIVRHRQAVLADAVTHTTEFARLYTITSEAVADERKIYRSTFAQRSESTLRRAVNVLQRLLSAVSQIREVTDALLTTAGSDGMREMCRVLGDQLDDSYLREAGEQVKELELTHGLLVSAQLDRNDVVSSMRPRLARTSGNWWIGRRPRLRKPTFSYTIAERDQAGMEAFSAFRDRSLTQVAHAADTSAEHILAFLRCLQHEMAFYLGCVRLRETLQALGASTCVPEVRGPQEGGAELTAVALRDVPLALQSEQAPVPVTVKAASSPLVVLTGANRGGKSTTLRAIGVAQLMAQAGVFVAADEFQFSVRTGIFTHFKREEDTTMRHGKFDEELERMSRAVAAIAPDGMLLANESFASTNEQEASDVGFDVITALIDSGATVLLVTHLFTLAQRLFKDSRQSVFLRAERGMEGERPYQLVEAPPLPTSFGGDIYRTVFGKPLNASPSHSRTSTKCVDPHHVSPNEDDVVQARTRKPAERSR